MRLEKLVGKRVTISKKREERLYIGNFLGADREFIYLEDVEVVESSNGRKFRYPEIALRRQRVEEIRVVEAQTWKKK